MNLKERNEFIRKFFKEKCIPVMENAGVSREGIRMRWSFFDGYCMGELNRKGHDYAHGGKGDANRNFKVAGDALGLSPYYVWAVFFFKHMDSILGWFQGAGLLAEGIESRITDTVNYLMILMSMLSSPDNKQFLLRLEPAVVNLVVSLFTCVIEAVQLDQLEKSELENLGDKIKEESDLVFGLVR